MKKQRGFDALKQIFHEFVEVIARTLGGAALGRGRARLSSARQSRNQNIEHSTSNIEHRMNRSPLRWMLNVECWMFDVSGKKIVAAATHLQPVTRKIFAKMTDFARYVLSAPWPEISNGAAC